MRILPSRRRWSNVSSGGTRTRTRTRLTATSSTARRCFSAGFVEVGTIWQHLANRVLIAVR